MEEYRKTYAEELEEEGEGEGGEGGDACGGGVAGRKSKSRLGGKTRDVAKCKVM